MTEREIELMQQLGQLPPRQYTLNDPGTYLFIFALVGSVGLIVKIVKDLIKKNEQDIKNQGNDFRLSIKQLEEKLLAATVHKNDCSGKQDLWGERFDNVMCKFETNMVQNKKEHGDIISAMEKSAKAHFAQIADFAQKIDEMADCIRRLELGKEC